MDPSGLQHILCSLAKPISRLWTSTAVSLEATAVSTWRGGAASSLDKTARELPKCPPLSRRALFQRPPERRL
ncbi:hypothetical protein BaRGS_00000830, partial [Batillaria attramentaria]